jgi:hypothetical protein
MSTHAKRKSKLYQLEIDTRRKEDNNNEANGGCDGTLLYSITYPWALFLYALYCEHVAN